MSDGELPKQMEHYTLECTIGCNLLKATGEPCSLMTGDSQFAVRCKELGIPRSDAFIMVATYRKPAQFLLLKVLAKNQRIRLDH